MAAVEPRPGRTWLVTFWSNLAARVTWVGDAARSPAHEEYGDGTRSRPSPRSGRAWHLSAAERQVRGVLAPCRQAALSHAWVRHRRRSARAVSTDRGDQTRRGAGVPTASLRHGAHPTSRPPSTPQRLARCSAPSRCRPPSRWSCWRPIRSPHARSPAARWHATCYASCRANLQTALLTWAPLAGKEFAITVPTRTRRLRLRLILSGPRRK
jgi:hypothetical protein